MNKDENVIPGTQWSTSSSTHPRPLRLPILTMDTPYQKTPTYYIDILDRGHKKIVYIDFITPWKRYHYRHFFILWEEHSI